MGRILSDETISKHRYLLLYCLVVLWTTLFIVILAMDQNYGSWDYLTMLIYFALPSLALLVFVVRYNLQISQEPQNRSKFFVIVGSFLMGMLSIMLFSSVWVYWMFSSLAYEARLVITAVLNFMYGALIGITGLMGLMYSLKGDGRHKLAGILLLSFGVVYSSTSISFVSQLLLQGVLYATLITLGILILFYIVNVIKIPRFFEDLAKTISPEPVRVKQRSGKQRPNRRGLAKQSSTTKKRTTKKRSK